MSKKFINEVDDVVDDSLLGLVNSNSGIKVSSSCSRVVIRRKPDTSKVSLIAGGGSGHEPYAAGYVGEGLLTGAVAGNVFASPPSRHVQAALEETKSKEGSILFVINYTGDRLNFGLAAERFTASGGKAKVVTIADDVAIDNPNNRVGRRGLAGAVLTIKIAGAMSEQGKSLEEIYDFSKNVGENLSTLGVSLYPGSLPGKDRETHLAKDEIEIGLGIHGEPGKFKDKYGPVKNILQKLLDLLKEKAKMKEGEEFVVLINNLGSVSQIEMNIVNGEVIEWFHSSKITIRRLFSGTYMTSLDGHGISVTVLRLKESSSDILQYLDFPTKAPGWTPAISTDLEKSEIRRAPKEDSTGVNLSDIETTGGKVDESLLKECIESVSKAMLDATDLLNKLDGAAGDGDCGSTFASAAKAIKSNIGTLNKSHPQTLLQQLAIIFEQTVGGTSGALYALMLSSAASSFKKEVSSDACKEALTAADEAIQNYGGARPGDRTMVDALNAAVENLKSSSTKNFEEVWENAVKSSEKAAESTTNQKATVGRASYTTEDSQNQPDAGATAISLWLRSIWDVVKKHK